MLVTVPRVSRSEHFPDGFELHLLPPLIDMEQQQTQIVAPKSADFPPVSVVSDSPAALKDAWIAHGKKFAGSGVSFMSLDRIDPLGPLGLNFSQHGPTTRPSRRKDLSWANIFGRHLRCG